MAANSLSGSRSYSSLISSSESPSGGPEAKAHRVNPLMKSGPEVQRYDEFGCRVPLLFNRPCGFQGAGVASLDHAGNALLRDNDGLNFSSQRIRPVICITTKSVMIAPIVTANPVSPSKKNAYENSTR